jgi:hypothetical protein
MSPAPAAAEKSTKNAAAQRHNHKYNTNLSNPETYQSHKTYLSKHATGFLPSQYVKNEDFSMDTIKFLGKLINLFIIKP